MDFNLHTHTYRCGHAAETPEEYIQVAIKNGIKHMGFADHMPFAFPDGYEGAARVPVSQAKAYVEELRKLREKYKNEIDIYIGFEMEYYPTYFDSMVKNAKEYGAEYLIQGQHFIGEEYPNGIHSLADKDDPQQIREYADLVIAGIKSGVYTYVAHPDMFKFSGDADVFEKEMRRICVASKEYNVPLELNFLGIRDNRIYPNRVFWKIAGEEKSPVTFGFDAHSSEPAADLASLPKAMELVNEFDLNYIGMADIKFLSNVKAGE